MTKNHLLAAVSATLLIVTACATGTKSGSSDIRLSSSPRIPAATAVAKADTTKSDNTSVNLKLEHMAEPQKVDPNATAYVLWAKPINAAQPQNLGGIKVGEDLSGDIQTLTPFKNFRLFVTAEPNPQVLAPTSEPLLWTDINLG